MSLINGDCIEVMQRLPKDFFHAIVTDPPYGLKFMGKKWDNVEYGFHREWAEQALRVLKPGGHLISFGGTRTYHWMAAGVEDAGFEIRDMIQWLYGQGFPKSMSIGKAIDKAAGKEREKGPVDPSRAGRLVNQSGDYKTEAGWSAGNRTVTIDPPATPEAAQWEGWGTALKPAQEPIVLARKPFKGTVAKNVLEYGVAGLNIDATRVEYQSESDQASAIPQGKATAKSGALAGGSQNERKRQEFEAKNDQGRWPANVILDEQAGELLDEQTGVLKSGVPGTIRGGVNTGAAYGAESRKPGDPMSGYGDSGGASRFFYTAKASKSERNAGLPKDSPNRHPTVKPIDLMRYLVRLVTPPDGRILDPFVGSGTTGIAAELEGFRFVGIERELEYFELARIRIEHWKGTSE